MANPDLDKAFDDTNDLDHEFDSAPDVPEAPAPVAPAGPKVGKLEAAARGFGKGGSFGFKNAISGALQTAGDAVSEVTKGNPGIELYTNPLGTAYKAAKYLYETRKTPSNPLKTYRQNRDADKADDENAAKQHPLIFGASDAAGSAAGVLATSGLGAEAAGAQKLTRAARALKAMKTGATVGGVSALGNSDADLTKGEFTRAGKDVAEGVGMGAVGSLPGVGPAIGVAQAAHGLATGNTQEAANAGANLALAAIGAKRGHDARTLNEANENYGQAISEVQEPLDRKLELNSISMAHDEPKLRAIEGGETQALDEKLHNDVKGAQDELTRAKLNVYKTARTPTSGDKFADAQVRAGKEADFAETMAEQQRRSDSQQQRYESALADHDAKQKGIRKLAGDLAKTESDRAKRISEAKDAVDQSIADLNRVDASEQGHVGQKFQSAQQAYHLMSQHPEVIESLKADPKRAGWLDFMEKNVGSWASDRANEPLPSEQAAKAVEDARTSAQKAKSDAESRLAAETESQNGKSSLQELEERQTAKQQPYLNLDPAKFREAVSQKYGVDLPEDFKMPDLEDHLASMRRPQAPDLPSTRDLAAKRAEHKSRLLEDPEDAFRVHGDLSHARAVQDINAAQQQLSEGPEVRPDRTLLEPDGKSKLHEGYIDQLDRPELISKMLDMRKANRDLAKTEVSAFPSNRNLELQRTLDTKAGALRSKIEQTAAENRHLVEDMDPERIVTRANDRVPEVESLPVKAARLAARSTPGLKEFVPEASILNKAALTKDPAARAAWFKKVVDHLSPGARGEYDPATVAKAAGKSSALYGRTGSLVRLMALQNSEGGVDRLIAAAQNDPDLAKAIQAASAEWDKQ